MKKLVLKDNQNQILRVFLWTTDKAFVVYRKKLGRLEICSSLDDFKKEERDIHVLKEIEKSEMNQRIQLSTGHCLEYVDGVIQLPSYSAVPQVDVTVFYRTAIGAGCFFTLLVGGALFFKAFIGEVSPPKVTEPLIVKVIKPPTLRKPEKVVLGSRTLYLKKSNVSPKKPVKVKKSLKRMGVLAALGSLSKAQSQKKGGLNLGASKVSQGPGLRALSTNSGSGGLQSSIYNKKGLITLGLGAGGNIQGGGGYGTKGREAGGGKAAYGQLTLIGSGSTEDLSNASAMNLNGGAFDPTLIDKEIVKRVGQIHNCYDKALEKAPELKGIFVSHMFINGSGVVTSSKVHASSGVNSPFINACILGVLDKIKFPVTTNQQDVIGVMYKFNLTELRDKEGG